MKTFSINGKDLEMPAELVMKQASKEPGAWDRNNWLTVKLTSKVEGLRVHSDGKRIDLRKVDPSQAVGRWILIGDVIYTSTQIVVNRALPGVFTRTSMVEMLQGSVLNIGLCSPLFGLPGGAWQAEFVSGPDMKFTHIPHVWIDRAGTA